MLRHLKEYCVKYLVMEQSYSLHCSTCPAPLNCSKHLILKRKLQIKQVINRIKQKDLF